MRAGTPFEPGDYVQLTDPKGKHYTFVLASGKQFHTHKGVIEHDDLLGGPEGVVVRSTGGVTFLALKPLLSDFVLSMPRGATIVYPKDAAAIVHYLDLYPGARVIEAGVGSGALTCSLLRAVGDTGEVWSFERRPDFAEVARANVESFFGAPQPSWHLHPGDLVASLDDDLVQTPDVVDRVVLDMLAPWECVDALAQRMSAGAVIGIYVATTTQLSRTVEALREHTGFTEPRSTETIVRPWHVDGLAVRPDHRMVGHTGFIVISRRLAPGVAAPARRRRPAKGARPTDETAPPAAGHEE